MKNYLRNNVRLIGIACAFALVVSGISFWFGFEKGTRNIADIDFVSALKNKDSSGDSLDFAAENTRSTAASADFAPFWRAWKILDKNFVPVSTSSAAVVDNNKKVVQSIQGLVASYNDPYTVFFPPQEAKAFKEQTSGEFEGIGAVMNLSNGYPVVAQILPKTPSFNAGLKAGDVVVAIDGKLTAGLPLNEVIGMIRGPKESVVMLTVLRLGTTKSQDIKITRGVVAVPSTAEAVVTRVEQAITNVVQRVKATITRIPPIDSVANVANSTGTSTNSSTTAVAPEPKVEAKDFFIFGLSIFSRTSHDAFVEELRKFKASGTNNLIIDLRNNPGGYVDIAVDEASYFLPEGDVIMTEKSGGGKEEKVYRSTGVKFFDHPEKIKLVILVNKNSASAAEILAAALQEHGKAIIVGEKTYGKGSMQQLIDITPEMALKVTIARWYTPNGTSLSGNGLVPDHVVLPNPLNQNEDTALEKAIEILLEKK